MPTYQSAWLKAHYPAHFLSGVLTHDPGMYPKRLILDDARQLGITVLGLDVNASEARYVVERVDPEIETGPEEDEPGVETMRWSLVPVLGELPPWTGVGWGIRLSLTDVKGITEAEVGRIVAAREGAPYASLTDFWQRARVSRPVAERLVQAGAFDTVYGIGATGDLRRRGRVTRRDLLLQVADLDRHGRALERAARGRGSSRGRRPAGPPARQIPIEGQEMAGPPGLSVRERAAAQSRATQPARPVTSVQLALDLGDGPAEGESSGLPEMTASDRVRAELDILGLDASSHVLDFHQRFLDQLGVVRSTGLLEQRSRSQILVAGVKVATQTPPIRSGRRVIFLTLDDATGPVDATFFEDVQGPYAATVFGSWLLVVRGVVRRTGRRGISLRATGAWDLGLLADRWSTGGVDAALAEIDRVPETVAAPSGAAGAGAQQRVPDVAVRRHQAGRPGDRHGHRRRGPQAVAPQPGEHGMKPLGLAPWNSPHQRARFAPPPAGTPKSTAPSSVVPPSGPPWSGTPCSRCSAHRAAGSSTSAAAPACSRSGSPTRDTRSRWSTPAPTRSPRWPDGPPRVTSPTGSPASRATWPGCPTWSRSRVPTWCFATVCSGSSTTPPRVWPRSATCSDPAAPCRCWSASVTPPSWPGRWPATSGRPWPRSTTPATTRRGSAGSRPRRSPSLLTGSGFTPQAVHAVRVFADLVPGSLLDLEPGAGAALLELERAVAARPEYLTLASQLHVLATH